MISGTLILEIFGELNFDDAVEHFLKSMDYLFRFIGHSFNSDYRRFGFYAVVIKVVIPLKIFWRNDYLYKRLKSQLDYCFSNWEFHISLHLKEGGI